MDINNLTQQKWVENEETYSNYLKDLETWNSIPLLNANQLHSLKDSSLVRFRGMIQDMYDPEYYYQKYSVVHKESTIRTVKKGKYLDTAFCEENETIEPEGPGNVLAERQTFVVITAPGENVWIENLMHVEKRKHLNPPKSPAVTKRTLEHEETMETDEPPKQQDGIKKPCAESSTSSNTQAAATVSVDHILNFPLPNAKGQVCHLKIYKDSEKMKLNDLCEFIGFLSLDPILSHEAYHNDEFESPMEVQTHNPPPSLVPRIHCVSWKKLEHNNPLAEGVEFDYEKMVLLKKESMVVLTQLLLGDQLAAEYLLYHLMSTVYIRRDFMAIGKFSLNISNIPVIDGCDYVKELYSFIELLVPQSYYFAMTIEHMNELAFTPKKDYECNRLTSGILQLNNNTHFVIDETKLQSGKLNESGVKAVGAFSKAIKTQTVQYDFGFNTTQEFDCDIPFLVLSEGKSMLPSDYHVSLKPDDTHARTFREIVEAAKHFLKPELLNDIRIYLTLARNGKYELSENIQEMIQDEFVKMRQSGKVTGDDLHQLLVLTRLICLSEGSTSVNSNCWSKACELEAERKARLA